MRIKQVEPFILSLSINVMRGAARASNEVVDLYQASALPNRPSTATDRSWFDKDLE